MSLSVVLLTSAPAWRGSGTSLAKIAGGLTRAGHRALVLAGSDDVAARFTAENVATRRVPLQRTGWRELRAVSAALRAAGAGLVLADSPRDVRLATLATAFHPLPVVFRYNLSRRALGGDPVSRLWFARVALLVYQSEYARDRALRTDPWLASRPGQVVRNGFDGARHRRDRDLAERFRRDHALPAGRPVVVSGAALFLDKGYATAIEAMTRVAAARPVEYLICGAGDDAPAIAALAARYRLPVRLVGQLDRPDWSAALGAADLVLHPAVGELFGNVIAEAMLHERAVVAIDSGGTPELMGRGGSAGVLVPEGDPAMMAAAITALLDDPARRAAMGTAARARVLGEFPLELMERGYVRLLESCLGVPDSQPVRPSARLSV